MKRWLALFLKLIVVVPAAAIFLGGVAMRIASAFTGLELDSPWFFETVIASLLIGWALTLWLHFWPPRGYTAFWADNAL